ncbi:MAG: LacI family DNA-binding transcriptional regulator [bacterium]
MASINDVADLANVSISTVSRVLNNHPNVSKKKKQAVKEAIEELDYVPNALARGLVTKNTYSIGILISDIANDFYSILVRSIEDVLNKEGYFTVIGNTDWNKKKEKNYLNYFCQKQVDGFILASTTLQKDEISKYSRDLPVVLLDRDMESENIDKIRIDDFKGGYLAASHLINAGYKKLIHIKGPRGIVSSEDRKEGFLKGIEESENFSGSVEIIAGHYVEEAGYEAIKNHMENRDISVSMGIFSANDAMAFGVLKYLNENNIDCPQQIGLVGFDDVGLASYTNPPLTTITRPIPEIGHRAAEIILYRLGNKNKGEEYVCRDSKLDVQLVKRGSTIKKN